MSDRQTLIGIVVGPDPADMKAFVAAAVAMDATPVLFCADYETDLPSHIDDLAVLRPMDYLDAEAIDQVFADLTDWQARIPTLELADGTSLYDWRADETHPRVVWSWVPALMPNVHRCIRLVAALRAVIEAEQPAGFCLVGRDPDQVWTRTAMRQGFEKLMPEAVEYALQSSRKNPKLVPLRTEEGMRLQSIIEDFSEFVGDAADAVVAAVRSAADPEVVRKRVIDALSEKERKFQINGRGHFNGHAMLVNRGANGTQVVHDRETGKAKLLDEYSEHLPDGLIEVCREKGWRLTILYDGQAPDFAPGRSYSERYPSFVSEITSGDFMRIASLSRYDVSEAYGELIDGVLDDPGFRAAFTFDGVDFFDIFGAYLRRSIVNLSTVCVTQSDAFDVLFSVIRPDVIFGGRLESRPQLVGPAHKAGAKVATVKLGIGEEMIPSITAIRPDGQFEELQFPDMLLLWGDYQADFVSSKFPNMTARLEVSGRTRNDSFIVQSISVDPVDTAKRLGLNEGERVITFGATSQTRYGMWPGHAHGAFCLSKQAYRDMVAALSDVAREVGNTRLLIKPHPVDDMDMIRDAMAKYCPDIGHLITRDDGFHNLEILAVSDVFVSTVSSMFAEAALLGRVSVNSWLPEVNYLYEANRWTQYNNLSVGTRSIEEMAETTHRLLNEPTYYRQELKRIIGNFDRFFGGSDGGNARRAALLGLGLHQPIDANELAAQ